MGKTFDAWNSNASAIPAEAQWALRSLDWIGWAENLVLVGPSGTGKSHFAEAIAHVAIDHVRISLISPLWFAGIRHPVSRVFAAFSEAAPAADAGRQFIP